MFPLTHSIPFHLNSQTREEKNILKLLFSFISIPFYSISYSQTRAKFCTLSKLRAVKQDLNLMEQRQIWRCGCLEERVAKGGQGIGCERGDESFICRGKIQMGVEWR